MLQEERRKQSGFEDAVPPALAKPLPVGCLVSLVASVTLLAVLFALTKSIGGFVFGFGLALVPVATVGGYLYGLLLLAIVQKRWLHAVSGVC
jgi:hypothetical protein